MTYKAIIIMDGGPWGATGGHVIDACQAAVAGASMSCRLAQRNPPSPPSAEVEAA